MPMRVSIRILVRRHVSQQGNTLGQENKFESRRLNHWKLIP